MRDLSVISFLTGKRFIILISIDIIIIVVNVEMLKWFSEQLDI